MAETSWADSQSRDVSEFRGQIMTQLLEAPGSSPEEGQTSVEDKGKFSDLICKGSL